MIRQCELCGRWCNCHSHHLIGGTANRKNAERYNLTMYLCPDCHRKAHEDPETYKMLHRFGQRRFVNSGCGKTEDFIRIFGKSYFVEDGDDNK